MAAVIPRVMPTFAQHKIIQPRQQYSQQEIELRRDERLQEIKRKIVPNSYNMFNIPYDLLKLEKHSLTPCYFDNKTD